MKKKFLEAGQIVNTHGVRGEVKIAPWADSPEFLKGFKTLYIDEQPVGVLSSRVHAGFVIARLEGVSDINDAMRLKNKTVFIDRADAHLPAGRFFVADIIGARAVTEDGADIGRVAEVIELPANNVFRIEGETEHLIPDVPEFILSADVENGLLTVRLIEGM